MNTTKSWLISMVMLGFFSISAIASSGVNKEPKAINDQFYKLLKGVDFEMNESGTILIDFMVNEKSEIIVLSTSNKNLDTLLKSRLNYKTLEAGDLKYFRKYTIPVRIDKK